MKIILQNIAPSFPQKQWVSIGLPKEEARDAEIGVVVTDDGNKFPAAIFGQELFVEALLQPNQTVEGKYHADTTSDESVPKTFQFSDWVMDEPHKLIPIFYMEVNGHTFGTRLPVYRHSIPRNYEKDASLMPFVTGIPGDSNAVRQRFYLKTHIPEVDVYIEGWFDFFHKQDATPFIIRCTYGNTNKTPLYNVLPDLKMLVGEKPQIDFWKRKGLAEPIYRADLKMWEVTIVESHQWMKTRTVEVFGNLLCLPPYDRFALEMGKEGATERYQWLQAKAQGPIKGIADVWEDNWLAFGKVPDVPVNGPAETIKAYNNFMADMNKEGGEFDPRKYAQPPNSGQTGEQADFGASKCELAVTMKKPWALHEYRFSAQAWMLRPYANIEPNGAPTRAAWHPNTVCLNLRPDERFSSRDMMGWPNPVGWISGYTTSDSQHRSDNLLYGMYALTRDPSLKATIDDMLELEKMNLKAYGTAIGPPRGAGRPLIALAHALHLFPEREDIRALLAERVDFINRYASFKKNPDFEVKVFDNNGSKYGWNYADGTKIRAWICWEESILVMGLWAVYKVTGDIRARDLALEVAKTLTKYAFFLNDNKWYSCYCVKWNVDGSPIPESSYNLSQPNYDAVVYGIHRWILPSLRILRKDGTADKAVLDRAVAILEYFGDTPKSFEDAGWFAVA